MFLMLLQTMSSPIFSNTQLISMFFPSFSSMFLSGIIFIQPDKSYLVFLIVSIYWQLIFSSLFLWNLISPSLLKVISEWEYYVSRVFKLFFHSFKMWWNLLLSSIESIENSAIHLMFILLKLLLGFFSLPLVFQ